MIGKQKKLNKIYGITEKQIKVAKDELFIRFNKEPSEFDVIWLILNKFVSLAIKENNFLKLQEIYFEMAHFLKKEGKDNFKFLQLSQKMYLVRLKQESSDILSGVEVLAAVPDSCPACTKLNGKVYTIDQALVNMPIPNKDCIHKKGCRCTYIPVIKE